MHNSRCGREPRLAATAIIRSSRYQASRAPSLCLESCTRSSTRLAVTQVLSLASRGPGWLCSDGMSSQPCSVCCSPIRCATCVCRAALVLECCGCVPAWLPTPMQAGHPFAEESAPLENDRRDDRRLPHRRRWHRMQHRLALTQWDDRSVRQAMPPASNRWRSCWSSRRR